MKEQQTQAALEQLQRQLESTVDEFERATGVRISKVSAHRTVIG